MRSLVIVVAMAAGLWLGWRAWRAAPPGRPAPVPTPDSAPVAANPALPPLPTRPPVEVRTQLDPNDPELREAVERLGEAVEPAIESIAVPTIDAAMGEYARRRDVQELQARLERLIAAQPSQASRLHVHFLSAKDPELLFVLAKVAAGRLEGDGFLPWIETAESGSGEHRRFAMYALAGDSGPRSLEALAKTWGEVSAGPTRVAAGFVLEGRIEELSESARESIRVVCREELSRATDSELQAETLRLLASPRLAAVDIAAVVEVVLSADRDESVRLAALEALATGDATAAPIVVEALDRLLDDPAAPDRLRLTAMGIRWAGGR